MHTLEILMAISGYLVASDTDVFCIDVEAAKPQQVEPSKIW